MTTTLDKPSSTVPIGIGYYTAADAARLLRMPPRNVRRWLAGYTTKRAGKAVAMPPLWTPQLPANDDHLELGFRDLVELRFVAAFTAEGLALQTIRACLATARELVDSDHPFSTQRFKTDGKRIFLETVHRIEHGPADGSNLPPLPQIGSTSKAGNTSSPRSLSGPSAISTSKPTASPAGGPSTAGRRSSSTRRAPSASRSSETGPCRL